MPQPEASDPLVAYVPAEPGWWADTVGGHFADWAAAAPFAERLGLPGACGAWPVQRLSTGERQRLALARAFAFASARPSGPRVFLLDEPTAGLDAAQARRVGRRWLLLRDGRVEEAAPPP